MEVNIELFLVRFNDLKNAINHRPNNISWFVMQNEELQDLCCELKRLYNSVTKYIEIKDSKHLFAPKDFENNLKEYELNYHVHVSKAAALAEERIEKDFSDSLDRKKEEWIASGKTEEEFWDEVNDKIEQMKDKLGLDLVGSAFDPHTDNPPSLMESAKDLLGDFVLADDESSEPFDKAYGAWDFYEKTIGINFHAIYERWKKAPYLFIPLHLQSTNTAPLIQLYHEAVRSYTFGSTIASVVMCRTLMEHILKKHYYCEEENLQSIIALAERKFPHLKKFNMDKKRKLANEIVHKHEERQEELEDKAVIEYLKTIKHLVQKVPAKNR